MENLKIKILTAEQKAHLIASKEKQKQIQREWYQANKIKMRDYQKQYYHEKLKTDDEYKAKLKSTKRKETAHKYYLKRKEMIKMAENEIIDKIENV